MGSRVKRYDLGSLAPPEPLDNGWLRCEGKIARVGIQEYEDADGTHRELRLPEDVFDPDSLRTFEMVPVTNCHPPTLLDADNTRSHQVGQVGQQLRRDGDYVVAALLLTDAEAIVSAKCGRSQLSNGYTCELDSTQDPALVSTWGPYNFIQRKIRGNHVALVDAARAGPEARVRLDSGAARMIHPDSGQRAPAPTTTDSQPEKPTMTNLRIGTFTIDPGAADAQAVIDRTLEAMQQRADQALAKERDRADQALRQRKVLLDNSTRLVGLVQQVRVRWDAMKAMDVQCDECGGAKEVDGKPCGFCDGAGTVQVHKLIRSVGSQAEHGPDDGDEITDMEEAVGEAADMDADELEAEQGTETEAGKAAKADAAHRRLRRDAASERQQLRAKRADSLQRQVSRSVRARLDLELAARRYLDEADVDTAKLATMDELAIMRAVVSKLAPTAKLDGKTPDQVRARYDAEIERAPAITTDQVVALGLRGLPHVAPRVDTSDPKAARQAYLKRLDEQAKGKRQGATK